MISLRSPNGLGDAIYLRAIVLHLVARGEEVTVFTKWKDVFSDLPVAVREVIDITPNDRPTYVYCPAERVIPEGLSDFVIRCRSAGIKERVELKLDWKVKNQALLDQIKRDARGRKIFIYQCARAIRSPISALLKPRREAFNKFIERHADHYRIKLGHPPHVEDDPGAPCELDLFGKAFIFGTFDVCTIGDIFFGQASFINCIAEALDKPHITMFARAALASPHPRANSATPERVFAKKHLATAVYDDAEAGACAS